MNLKEKEIILKEYSDLLYSDMILKIDKSDTLRHFRNLLKGLNLIKEMYATENEIICYRDNVAGIKKEMFRMIIDTFAKYNKYVKFDIDEIELYFDNLQYEMTEEEKCHHAQMKYLKD